MELALAVLLFLAAALTLRPPNGARARLRRVRQTGPRVAAYPPGPVVRVGSGLRWPPGRSQSMQSPSMTLLVQQLAALLKGGRAPARIWDELSKVQDSSGGRGRGNLSVGSTAMVAAACVLFTLNISKPAIATLFAVGRNLTLITPSFTVTLKSFTKAWR